MLDEEFKSEDLCLESTSYFLHPTAAGYASTSLAGYGSAATSIELEPEGQSSLTRSGRAGSRDPR